MKDWPSPSKHERSNLVLYLEFWGLLALTVLAVGASLGPWVIGLIGKIFIPN